MTSGRLVVIVVVVALLGGLGVLGFELARTGNQSAACGAPFAERIDANSSQHVLPGAAEPSYLTNPPTSGAHKPGAALGSVATSPLDKPTQVGILEGGRVLIQYRQAPSATREKLVALAKVYPGEVTVAPNNSLPAKIIATAWLYKMVCRRFSASDLSLFVRTHFQKDPAN